MSSPFRRPGQTLVIAHRGASADAPENTLRAFRLAAAQGADGVEMDVRLCGTGEPVVFHDATLGRIFGVAGRVEETSLDDLRALDAGGGERVSTLDEALAATPFELALHLELKLDRPDDRGLVARTVEAVRAAARPRVGIVSFHPGALARARLAAPEIPTGLIFEARAPWLVRSGALAPVLRCRAASAEDAACTPALVALWHAAGLSVNVWTVDGEDAIARFAAMGVDAITTNRPAVARAVLDRR